MIDEIARLLEDFRVSPYSAVGESDDASYGYELLLQLNGHRLAEGGSILDAEECVESLWGNGHQSIWAEGEPFLCCGPDGVGKTTLMQQLTLKLAGIGTPNLLAHAVHSKERRVLYLACDRPAQAKRSFHRMVTEHDRAFLDERLVLWRGPLPFDLAAEPDALLALARTAGCNVVVLDSLKDVAADLSKEETGQGLNRAFQQCCAEGVDIAALHHQRKAQSGARKPRHLADVYGSRWIPAGAGSVVMLWGEAGDPVVEFTHLKQPDEPVGPFQIVHDHVAGTSTVLAKVDAYSVVLQVSTGVTVGEVAKSLFGDEGHNSQAKARRQLERLTNDGLIQREFGGAKSGVRGAEPDRYHPMETQA